MWFKQFTLRRLIFGNKPKVNKAFQKDLNTEYRNLVEQSLVGIYIVQDNLFRYVNKRFCEIFGFTYKEIINKMGPIDLVYGDDKILVERKIRENILNKSDSFDHEIKAIGKDKKIIWVRLLGHVMQYQDKPALSGTIIEVTHHRQVEEELRISEERLRITLETTQIGIWDWDLENDTWYASPIYYTMLGYKPETEPGDRSVWLNRVHPEDREIVKEKINQILTQKATDYIYEARMLHANGSYRWQQVTGHNVEKNTQGKVTRLVGIRRDINDYKQTEENLKKNEGRLRTLIDTLPDLVWLKDPDGIYLKCNQRFELFFGVPENEIIGKDDYDFVDKELADFFRQKDIEAKEAGKPSVNEEQVTFSDGHQEILETIKTPIFEENGKFIGVLGIGRDITQRKQTENELKESEELFKNILKLTPYPIVLTDLDGRYILVNNAYFQINNISEHDVIGKTITEQGFVIDKASNEAIRHAIATKGRVENVEVTITDKNGTQKDFIYSCLHIKWKNKPMILHSSIDITEKNKTEHELDKYRKHLELLVKKRTNELNASNAALKSKNIELINQKEELQTALNELNKTKNHLIHSEKMASLGVLSAGIAHEINNPLNFIHGGSVGLETYLKEHEMESIADLKPFLNAINIGIKRATAIVASLSHYSRQEDLPKTDCNLHSIIDNCLIMLQSCLKGKVEVTKHYMEEQPIISGNEGKLHQAILSILSNAEQSIQNTGTIDITTHTENKHFTIIITDSGTGITPEIIKNIFDPFFTTKPPGKGIGLGLSITYNIIQEHGGGIEIKSKLNEGTKAIIKFPILK